MTNGFEERNTPWEHSRRRYDAGTGLRSLADLKVVTAFFEARRGQLHGFRWKDWADHTSRLDDEAPQPGDQRIGVGDNTAKVFRLVKRYEDVAGAYERPIVKPIDGSVMIALDGQELTGGWSVDARTGIVRFDVPPAAGVVVEAGFRFDVPVRFDTDRLAVSVESFHAGQVPSIPVVEVRL